jgi:FHA domain-containing protein
MIAIRVESVAGEPLHAPLAATFANAGGAIGRGFDCVLVLPDPDRLISRRQAMIVFRDGQPFIRQIGSNLVIELDGEPLASEIDYPLADGAGIRIGPYVLRVGEPRQAVAADEVLAGLEPRGKLRRPSVFGDLLGGPPVPGAEPPAQAAPAAASAVAPQEIDLIIGETSGLRGHQALALVEAADDDPVAALFAGLGLVLPPPAARSAPQLQLVGELLRACLEGMLGLLAARALAKRQLGASPTLLETARANNPLKFSPDADVALAHLLGPAQRGFLAPLDAVHEAFDDLRRHEAAVLAGTRAAVQAVLARFDPQALEARQAPDAMWDNLLPAHRKAKLWEQFEERYAKVLEQSREDFDSLFRRAFVKAYEAQAGLPEEGDAGDAAGS